MFSTDEMEDLSSRLATDPSLLAKVEAILKKPGAVRVKKEKIDPFSRPPHHSLQVITYCNLCHSHVIKLFNMYSDGGTKYLSKSVSDFSQLVEPRERQLKAVMNCPQCPHELQKWSKEKLIRELVRRRTSVLDELHKLDMSIKDLDTTIKEEEEQWKLSKK